MTYIFIFCRSLTYAQRAAKLLERQKIGSTVLKIPANLSENGCGYGVMIKMGDGNKAISILESNRIPIRGKYVVEGGRGGKWSEI